jgi:hypothetical protein
MWLIWFFFPPQRKWHKQIAKNHKVFSLFHFMKNKKQQILSKINKFTEISKRNTGTNQKRNVFQSVIQEHLLKKVGKIC